MRFICYTLILFTGLLMTGCASMMIKKYPEQSIDLDGEIATEDSIKPGDNFFSIMPVVPLFGSLNGGQTTGNFGVATGLNICNTHMRYGSINIDALYHFTFNNYDNDYTLSFPAPFGKKQKITGQVSYSLPFLHLSSKTKEKPVILGNFQEKGQQYCLYTNRKVKYERQVGVLIGVNSQYITTILDEYNSNIVSPDHTKLYQRANSVSAGLVFSRTSNTSLTALVDDPRFKPRYEGRRTGRDEFYLSLNVYVWGNVLPVITSDSISGGKIFFSAKDPEDDFLQLKRIGAEAGYSRLIFANKHLAYRVSAALGSGTGYIPNESRAFYVKLRMLLGFGVIRSGK